MQTLWQDLRYGVRMLLKKPGLTLIAVLTLALGIGANTAIFSVVNAVLLRPLPYPEHERLMQVFLNNPETASGKGGYGNADFQMLRERNQSFAQIAAISSGDHFTLTGRAAPDQVIGAAVTAEFFDALGVRPQRGRTFLAGEDKPGSPRTVVVSHSFWEKYLGSNPNAVGQTVALNNESFTVIGVTPSDFRFNAFGPAELWTALRLDPPRARPPYFLRVIGRLKPGVSERQAQADVSAIADQTRQQYPNSVPKVARLEPFKHAIVGDAQLSLSVLLGAVFFVLLIASVNVANLLLARATEREREIAVRSALGASRFRLIKQALTESGLLALLGGALGLLLAQWGVDLIVALSPENLPRIDEISLDGRVLGFTLLTTCFSSLVFGLAPALQCWRPDLNTTLKEGGRSGAEGFRSKRLRELLIVSEFALALILLIGAGLMIRSFLRLQRVNPGFEPDRVLAAQIILPQSRYREAAKVGAFQQQLLHRVQALPGAQAAAVSMSLPPDILMMRNPFTVEGQTPAPGQSQPTADQLLVSPDYFRALGIRQLSGRSFTDADDSAAPQVVIINEALARQYFPQQDPVGKRLQTGDYRPNGQWLTVVGVVADVKYNGLHEDIRPTVYTAFQQNLWWRSMYLTVKAGGDPLSLVNAVRNEVWALDRDLPVSQIKTMDQLMSDSVAEPRVYTLLLGVFGAVALLLAAVGIYGVMAYAVTLRTREIGVRVALGAQAGAVLRLVVGAGMKLALIGMAIGLLAAFAVTRLMAKLLFDVSPTDPVTFALIALLLLAVALLACYLPARRAMKVDPMVALRFE